MEIIMLMASLTFQIINVIFPFFNLILIGIEVSLIIMMIIMVVVRRCQAGYSRSFLFNEPLIRLLIDVMYSCYALYLHRKEIRQKLTNGQLI